MQQLWPPIVEPSTLTSYVHDDATAQGIPGLARGLQLYAGLLGQLELDQVKDGKPLTPRPMVLNRPDPNLSRVNYVGQGVRDYWVHGNAASLVVARDYRGIPAAATYFPPHAWSIPLDDPEHYYLHGQRVAARDVLHVQRGVDPANPRRGLGVVEQHLRTLKRAGLQERYEENALAGAGVPSVAVIAPQQSLTQGEVDDAADKWDERFSGPQRRAAILPHGTSIQTLSWNPGDQELVLARKITQVDLANLMNLDPYWMGAEGSSHTYRSPGGMFVALMRSSLEPVMQAFEDVYTRWLVPYGSSVRFNRPQLTRDDMQTMATWGRQAIDGGLMTVNEWRDLAGLPRLTDPAADQLREPKAAAEPTPDPDPEPTPALAGTTTEGA